MKPSDIVISNPTPLLATFKKAENEFAASLLILACQDNGDEWQPILPPQVGDAMKAHNKKFAWIEFSLRFAPPNFDALVRLGDTEPVGDESEGRKRPFQFTEQGIEKLRTSRWNKAKKRDD